MTSYLVLLKQSAALIFNTIYQATVILDVSRLFTIPLPLIFVYRRLKWKNIFKNYR